MGASQVMLGAYTDYQTLAEFDADTGMNHAVIMQVKAMMERDRIGEGYRHACLCVPSTALLVMIPSKYVRGGMGYQSCQWDMLVFLFHV